jgi:hypothetical protein
VADPAGKGVFWSLTPAGRPKHFAAEQRQIQVTMNVYPRLLAPAALFLLLLSPLSVAVAQTAPPSGEPEEAEEKVEADFSRDRLLQLFREKEEEPETDPAEAIEFRRVWRNYNFRFVPLVAPLRMNDGSYGRASIMQVVDPFTLLGMEYPHVVPADLAELRGWSWSEKRYRKRMLGMVSSANRSDNGS